MHLFHDALVSFAERRDIKMITLFFVILMLAVFGKLAVIAIKATWGITKILFSIVFLPIILIILALSGCMVVAVPILAIVGLIALFSNNSCRA